MTSGQKFNESLPTERKGDPTRLASLAFLLLMPLVVGCEGCRSKGQAERIMKRWIYSYGNGRVILSVREDNAKAVELYRRMNFEIVGERCWGKSQIKGLVMKFDF